MKKRWGILLGITGMAMAALLTGCKGTGEAKAPGEAGGETSVETSAAGLSGDKTGDAAAGAAGEGQITFTFAEHVANIEQQAPQVYGVVQEYMKLHPNVTIELTGASADDLTRNIQMAAQSNTLPDLFWIRQPVAVEMAKAGYLADLSEDILNDRELTDTFLPHVLDSLKIDGKLYGIPCELQSNGFWVNKAILDQYGLEMPVTYEDFISCCTVLKENGIIPVAQGGKDVFTAWAWENAHCRYGFYDHIDGIIAGTDKWSNPDYLKFYQKLSDMRDAGVFSENAKNTDYALSVEQFLSGQAAMLNSGVWDTKKFDQSDLAKDIYYWWGPTFEDGVGEQEVSMKAPAHPYVVSACLKEEEPEKYAAVIDFLKFYYGKQGTEIIAKDNQSIPVTRYEGEIDAETYPVFARVITMMNDDWESPAVCPDMYISGQIINQYRESICGVINGIYTPREAVDYLDGIQATIQ